MARGNTTVINDRPVAQKQFKYLSGVKYLIRNYYINFSESHLHMLESIIEMSIINEHNLVELCKCLTHNSPTYMPHSVSKGFGNANGNILVKTTSRIEVACEFQERFLHCAQLSNL